VKKFHFVTLFITRRCDLACSYCDDSFHLPISGPKAPQDRSFEGFWDRVLERWCPETEYFSILGGEPTLHKDLDKIIQYIFSQGCKLGITTDGRLEWEKYAELVDKGLPEIAVSIDSLEGNCANKSAAIKSERNYRLLKDLYLDPIRRRPTLIWCTVVTKQNVGEVVAMAQRAKELGCIFAPCPVQQGYENSLMVASQGHNSAAHPDDLARVGEILLKNYDELSLAEPMSYYELWTRKFDMDVVWHCNDQLRAPSIDYDGTMWACYALQGQQSSKLHALRSTWDEILQASQKDAIACKGCSWNCLYTSNGITDGTISPANWV